MTQRDKDSRPPPAITPFIWMVVWVSMSAGWLVGFTDGDSALFIQGFRDTFFPQIQTGLGMGNPQDRHWTGLRPFCTFHRADVQLYLALPHLSAHVGSLTAAHLSHRLGRKPSVWLGCVMFILAKVLLATSYKAAQVWVARIGTGFAVGLLHQAPMLEVLEFVPFNRRGALAACQALGRSVGFLCSALLTFGLALDNRSWQWRLVPVFGIWPALLMIVLLVWLPETPSSLLQRGKFTEARLALQRLRGMLQSTEQEYAEILQASHLFSTARTQFQALRQQREAQLALYAGLGLVTVASATGGQLLMTSAFPVFYALGYGRLKGYTMSLILIAFGALLGSLAAVLAADTVGRRRGTVAGCLLSAACYIAVALIIQLVYFGNGAAQLPLDWAWAVGALISLACGFDFAANSLLWIFAFEVQPLPTRSLSTGIVLAWHSLQAFGWMLVALPLLCHMRGWGLFVLFTVASIATAVLAWLFMVPTQNTPLELLESSWSKHWFWHRYCSMASKSLQASYLCTSSHRSYTLSDPGSLSPGVVRFSGSHHASEQMLQQLAYLQLAGPLDASVHRQQQHLSAAGLPGEALHSPPYGSWQLSAASSIGGSSNAGGSSHAGGRGPLVDAAMFQRLSTHPGPAGRAAAGRGASMGSEGSGVAEQEACVAGSIAGGATSSSYGAVTSAVVAAADQCQAGGGAGAVEAGRGTAALQ